MTEIYSLEIYRQQGRAGEAWALAQRDVDNYLLDISEYRRWLNKYGATAPKSSIHWCERNLAMFYSNYRAALHREYLWATRCAELGQKVRRTA